MNTIKGVILITSLMLFASCTFDYFEDETNYVVYAPKADSERITDGYKIGDIHIYIYNGETLARQKTASFPFRENMRMKNGNFNFRLFPGSFNAFCFANTEGIVFSGMPSLQNGGFGLPESDNGTYHYPDSLASFSVEFLNPTIDISGLLVTDTAYFDKRYSGRICVAFEKLTNLNPLLTYSNIQKIKVEATGTGVFQPMFLLTDSVDTRSSSYTPSDRVMMELPHYENPFGHYEFGMDGYFFPSLGDGRPISLKMDFFDYNGNSIHAFSISVLETLHINQTIYIGTDGISSVVLDIPGPEQWNPEIVGGGEMGI